MSHYAFSPHIHAACLNGIYVLLDERADRYLCLSEPGSRLLSGILDGEMRPDACQFVAELTRQDILMPASPDLRAPRPPPRATSSVYRSTPVGRLTPQEWPAALRVLKDARSTRRRPLAETLRTLRREQARRQPMDLTAVAVAGETAARFTAFSDLFLTRTDACLPRSLMLTRFLRRRRIAAHLTIGVKLGPFAAHAWVEYQDSVVNDHLETVQAYTPILRI